MIRIVLTLFMAMLVIQGCDKNHTLKEDIKDVGQDLKNEFNKVTD